MISEIISITFSWKRDSHYCQPISISNFLNQDGVSLLDCLLMDNGGLPYLETISWLSEGVDRVKSVATGEVECSDWIRETWGVELKDGQAKIFSLFQEEYAQNISLDVFLNVLEVWTGFVQSEPDSLGSQTLKLSING